MLRGWVLRVAGRAGPVLAALGGTAVPSICASAAGRGTVTRLFLTVWGGRRGDWWDSWLYH